MLLLISVIGDMTFGQKLRKLREKKQLAEKLGYVTNSYISDVESGRFLPSREKLKKIRSIDQRVRWPSI